LRVGAISHQFYVRAAVGRKDRWRDQANSHPIRPGQNYQRNPLVSSTTRVQGQRGCRPFPLHPQSPPDLLRFASDHLTRTILLDEAEHFLHNHHASVASLRLLFTFIPERRSACLRNRCSPSPEYPLDSRFGGIGTICFECHLMRTVLSARTGIDGRWNRDRSSERHVLFRHCCRVGSAFRGLAIAVPAALGIQKLDPVDVDEIPVVLGPRLFVVP